MVEYVLGVKLVLKYSVLLLFSHNKLGRAALSSFLLRLLLSHKPAQTFYLN